MEDIAPGCRPSESFNVVFDWSGHRPIDVIDRGKWNSPGDILISPSRYWLIGDGLTTCEELKLAIMQKLRDFTSGICKTKLLTW